MDRCQIKAYAKINLGLDVVRRLPNGYHQVRMIMQTVNICDELTLERTDAGIILTADSEELPTDGSNLICRAAALMRERYHITEGVRIHLHKRIPIAAGMAGGSTDAAAAMKGMSLLFDLDAPLPRLMEYGIELGADVPYCLMGGTALAEGIGEKLTALPPIPGCTLLVAKPDCGVSTRFVYEHLDTAELTRHPDIDGMRAAIEAGNLQGILDRMENVLETVTIPAHPIIDTIKHRMLELGALRALMSGSGPTVFGVFPDESAARLAEKLLQKESLAKQLFVTAPV